MNTPAILVDYLEDVLGLRSIFCPEARVSHPDTLCGSEYRSQGDNPSFLLWLPSGPSPEEEQLLQKIMKAAEIANYIVFWGSEPSKLKSTYLELRTGLQLYSENAQDTGQKIQFADINIMKTLSLQCMLKGTSVEITRNKRVVWNHLKEIIGAQSQ